MRALTIGLTLLLSGWLVTAQSVPPAERVSAISHYDLELRPQLEARTIEVQSHLRCRPRTLVRAASS